MSRRRRRSPSQMDMEASRRPQMPSHLAPGKGLVRVPDSLRDDHLGMRRLDLMVNTVFERMVADEDQPDSTASGHAA